MTDPETIPLRDACDRLGISYRLGKQLASHGHDLCTGVRILRVGSPDSLRPLYRVPVAQLDSVLHPQEAS